MTERILELEEIISKNIELYYKNSNSAISNTEFDSYVEELEELNPNSSILKKLEVNLGNYPKLTLPFRLYSLKKVKTLKEIENWIKDVTSKVGNICDEKIVISAKVDGIHLLNYFEKSYTRGEDGVIGFDVSSRAKNFHISNKTKFAFGGELICSKENFKKYFSSYTSPRNLIQSFFTNKETPLNMDKIDYIRYSVYNMSDFSKEVQLKICNEHNSAKIPYKIILVKDLEEKLLDDLFKNWSKEYNIDGLVIDLDNPDIREKLGYIQKYPQYARSFKPARYNQELKKTKIRDIRIQLSRYGKIAPIAEVEPTSINDGVVTNASLYNMKYVVENDIKVGQEGYIYRAGSINPKFEEFICNENLPSFELNKCPFCGEKLIWDSNYVDLYCVNSECKEIKTQKINFFFSKIGIKNFGLETIRSFVYEYNLNLSDFFNKEFISNASVKGIGELTKQELFDQLEEIKEKGVILEKIQEASGLFEGIAESSLKLLNVTNIDIEHLYSDSYYNEKRKELLKISGIGEIMADEYLYKLSLFWTFYKETLQGIIPILVNKNNEDDLKGIKVCFTGFRSEELKKVFEQRGGIVSASVSNQCNFVITNDKEGTSSKIQKAKDLEIPILSIDEFKKRFNL